MKNKTLGSILLINTVLAFVAYSFDGGTMTDFADGLYTIVGMAWLVFSTWAGFRLYNEKRD